MIYNLSSDIGGGRRARSNARDVKTRETQDQAPETEELSRGVALRGFESHPPHQTSSPNPSPIFLSGAAETVPDVYKHENRFQNASRNLRSSKNISEANKKSITEFVQELLTQGVSKARATKYLLHLTVLARQTRRPFNQFIRRDVEQLVGWIQSQRYTDHTRHDYKVVLKRYFQWLRGCNSEEHEYPEEVKWIKTSFKGKRLLPESLLTKEELERLVSATENQRDRALVLTHYESGCRIGEILSLAIKNVVFDRYGAVIIVNGKTGARRVRIITVAPALAAWLSIHPLRHDQNAPLWVGVGGVGRYKPLDYDSVRGVYRRLAKRAGLDKRLYTHLFRHTRATELANILTEAQMKEHLGWVQGSDMPSIYVHLSGRDVDSALLKAQGIAVEEKKPLQVFMRKACSRCRQNVSPESDFCPFCGLALNERAAIVLEENLHRLDDIMNRLMKDEEFKSFLERKIAQIYSSSQPSRGSRESP